MLVALGIASCTAPPLDKVGKVEKDIMSIHGGFSCFLKKEKGICPRDETISMSLTSQYFRISWRSHSLCMITAMKHHEKPKDRYHSICR